LLSGFFNFIAIFETAVKICHQHFKHLYSAKILALPAISADMECARQTQAVMPVIDEKLFCLSQDGERTDLFLYSQRP
jgi:hypothetical protein